MFPSNYHICEYFYFDDVDNWWRLKTNIYAVIVTLAFLLSGVGARGTLRFFSDIGVGLAISNVADRLYFDTTEITKEDIIMVLVTLLFAILDYKKEEPNANTTSIIRKY